MRPETPTDDDCCHNGCVPCVFDIYEENLKRWKNQVQDPDSSRSRHDLLSETIFKPFKLSNVQKLTEDTNLYTFTPLDEGGQKGLLPINSGQHLIMKFSDEKQKKQKKLTTRAFTAIDKGQNCSFDVVIKLYKNGIVSKHVERFQIGDVTYWRGPYGNFSYTQNIYTNLTMISMGTGIAPMYAVAKQIVFNDLDETIVHFLHGCKSSSDIILRDELSKLSSFWNFHSAFFLSRNFDIENKKHSENFIEGRIYEANIKPFLKSEEKDMFLICGSQVFSSDIKILLKKLGVKEANIYVF